MCRIYVYWALTEASNSLAARLAERALGRSPGLLVRICQDGLNHFVQEGFPVITTLAWKMCDKTVTPPFHFDHLPAQVPKSPHRSQDSESAQILAHILGGQVPQTYLSQKSHKIESFLSSLFRNFRISKVNFLSSLWYFRDIIWKDVSFLFLDNQF